MRASYFGSESERAAPSAAGGAMVGLRRTCPVCGAPMSGRKTSACSDKCRARKSHLARLALPLTEAGAMRAQLTTILETAWTIKATLERYNR